MNRWIKWSPTSKQAAFLLLRCREAFYGGGARGGKSVAALMAAAQYLDVPGYAAVIFRNSFADLMKPDGLIPTSHRWWANEPGARWDGSQHQWVMECQGGGHSVLAFSYLDGPYDHFSHQSAAYQYICMDEVVNIREHQALYMFTRLFKLNDARFQDIPLRFRAMSNPPAREQVAKGAWVRRRYVDPKTRYPGVAFIPALIDDNPYADQAAYRESLSHVDPVTRRQMEFGDWEIQAAGRMVERQWFQFLDVVPNDPRIRWVRAWDLASTAPSPKSKDPDYTAGVKAGLTPDRMIVIAHAVRFRKNPAETEQTIRHWAEMDGRQTPVYMEQEPGASGKIAVNHYRLRVLQGWNFTAVPSGLKKTARYAPFASQAEAGNVHIVKGDWNEEYLQSAQVFPDGEHDDLEDATSLAFSQVVTPMRASISIC